MYQTLIVEDTPEDAQALIRCIDRYAQEHDETIMHTWIRSAIDLMERSWDCDIIFLDIEMPGYDGMEAAHLMRTYDRTTPIIFVTNLAQYAQRGYEVDALDFLVKPVRYGDLAMRLDKVLRATHANDSHTLVVKTADGLQVFDASELAFVDVRVHDTTYHLADGSSFTVRKTLAAAEEEMSGLGFVKVSSACLANMDYVQSVKGDSMVLTTGDVLHMSRGRRKPAMQAIAAHFGSGF